MASIVHKLVRRTKRRIKVGRRDGRTHALFEAGIVLLARQDYEVVSITLSDFMAPIVRGVSPNPSCYRTEHLP